MLLAFLIHLLAPQQSTVSADGVVLGVADGDTLFMRVDGRRETVRLIGIDAMERT